MSKISGAYSGNTQMPPIRTPALVRCAGALVRYRDSTNSAGSDWRHLARRGVARNDGCPMAERSAELDIAILA